MGHLSRSDEYFCGAMKSAQPRAAAVHDIGQEALGRYALSGAAQDDKGLRQSLYGPAEDRALKRT